MLRQRGTSSRARESYAFRARFRFRARFVSERVLLVHLIIRVLS